MIIRDFEPKHTEEAAEIALDVYNYVKAEKWSDFFAVWNRLRMFFVPLM